jgi:hypothetical protein
MIGYRLPERIDVKSRAANVGSPTRCAIDCAKPLTSSGRSRSMKSSVSLGFVAAEQRSVDPATSDPTML